MTQAASVDAALLSVRDLTVVVRRPTGDLTVVDSVSFDVAPGETLAVVGESGSGKTLLVQAIVGLLPEGVLVSAGAVAWGELEAAGDKLLGNHVGMVFQNPDTHLNPLLRVGEQVAEVFREHGAMDRRTAHARAVALLGDMGLPDPERAARALPHELSGGMRQRALLAGALAGDPRLLIADEPTTALDVTTQARVLRLLARVRAQRGLALLLVSHDLGVVAQVADRIAVMDRGCLVELGDASDVLGSPRHDRTWALLAARDDTSASLSTTLEPVAGADTDPGPRPLLDVRSLTKHFPGPRRRFSRAPVVRAINGVDLRIVRGETLGLVGESGCGKSTLARCVLRLIQPTAGGVHYDGRDLATLPAVELRGLRRRMQLVFQDPTTALNPRLTVGELVAEGLEVHGLATGSGARDQAGAALRRVGLDPDDMSRSARAFSGGERQRIVIARALALGPELLVCDEPVSSLDVSTRGLVLDLLLDLQRDLGLAMLFISHDLEVVERISHRVAVMFAGRIVETAPADRIARDPSLSHPFTTALRSAVPRVDPDAPLPDPGETSEADPAVAGCAYAPRCPWAEDRCRRESPPLREVAAAHEVACHRVPIDV